MRNVLILAGDVSFDEVNFVALKYASEKEEKIVNTAKTLKESLSSCTGNNVSIVGDGRSCLSIEQIGQALDNFNNDAPLTIIYCGHGKVGVDGFEFITGKNYKIKVQDMFGLIKQKRDNQPVDFFSEACYGGAMHNARNLLPDNSVLVSLTDEQTVNSGSDFTSFAENFPKDISVDLTAKNILSLFMQTSLTNRFPPCISRSSGGMYNLNELYKDFVQSGEKIGNLQDKVSKGLLLPSTLEFIPKLNSAKREYDIVAKEYGKALALVFEDKCQKIKSAEKSSDRV